MISMAIQEVVFIVRELGMSGVFVDRQSNVWPRI